MDVRNPGAIVDRAWNSEEAKARQLNRDTRDVLMALSLRSALLETEMIYLVLDKTSSHITKKSIKVILMPIFRGIASYQP